MAVLVLQAQMVNPINFTSQLKQLKGNEAELTFSATIDAGWHVYSTGLGDDGPISASFHAVKMEGAETVGKLQTRGKEIISFETSKCFANYSLAFFISRFVALSSF